MERKFFLCFMSEIIQKISIQINMAAVRPEITCRMKFMVVVTIQVAYYYRITWPNLQVQ
jgi:hypothetical protein